MRKLTIAVAIFFVCAGCNDAGDATTNSANAEAEKNNANTRAVYTAFETGDVSKLDDFIAEDIIDHGADPSGKDVVGRDSVKAMFVRMHNAMDGLKMEVLAQGTGDGYHFSLVKMTGKVKDASMGMPVGTDISGTSVDVVKIKDGKATEHWSYMDPKQMMEMMQKVPQGSMTNPADSTKNN